MCEESARFRLSLEVRETTPEANATGRTSNATPLSWLAPWTFIASSAIPVPQMAMQVPVRVTKPASSLSRAKEVFFSLVCSLGLLNQPRCNMRLSLEHDCIPTF